MPAMFLMLPVTVVMLEEIIRKMDRLSSFAFYAFTTNLVTSGSAALIGTPAVKKIVPGTPFIEGWLVIAVGVINIGEIIHRL